MPHYNEGDIICNAYQSCVVLREFFPTSSFILVAFGSEENEPYTRIEADDLINGGFQLVTNELFDEFVNKVVTTFPDAQFETWNEYTERWGCVAEYKMAKLKELEQNTWSACNNVKPHAGRETVIGLISDMIDSAQLSREQIKHDIETNYWVPASVIREMDHIIDCILDEDV